MDRLSPHDVTLFFLSIGVLLAAARILGEIADRFRQPAVLGELIAGILLGPTVLGAIAPKWNETLFPMHGPRPLVLDGLTAFGIALYLLVAGMEVDLSAILRQKRTALSVSIFGVIIPFFLGLVVGWFAPEIVGRHEGSDPYIFALFLATALSISALPVIAKTLMDLELYRTDFGMIVIAAAMMDDLVGWLIFAVILAMMGAGATHGLDIKYTIALTLLYAVFVLIVVRTLVHRVLPWIQAYTRWPGGVLTFALLLAIFGAAFTQWIGVHAVFGAFLVGIAIGDSTHLRENTRTVIKQFVSFIFAPLFFASIGLKVNFATNFDLRLVLVVFLIACVGKVAGCGFGARWIGSPKREAAAIGFAMNARGAMEIILGMLALQAGVIREPMFVALVFMALGTSLLSGPMIQKCLQPHRHRRFIDFLKGRAFIPFLEAKSRADAIRELCHAAAATAKFDGAAAASAAIVREEEIPTGLGSGLAAPHAKIAGLAAPMVAVGISIDGIDFGAPDKERARIICLILTPANDDTAQLQIVADFARTFKQSEIRERVRRTQTLTEFLAELRMESP